MSIQTYPNGIGGTLGDTLDTCRPLQTTGNVWYVSSLIGSDGSGTRGQDRIRPLATIAQAQTNASDNDIVCCLAGHTETYTSPLPVTKKLVILGEGINAGIPQVSIVGNAAAVALFVTTTTNVEFRNLYFPQNLVSNTSPKIVISANGARIRGCYFACGPTDTGAQVSVGASFVRIENSTFISVATALNAQPLLAIQPAGASSITDLAVENIIVSGGAFGFSNYAAIDLSPATSVLRANFDNLQLLLGADLEMGTGTTGRVNIQLATGGSRVHWA